MKKGFSTLFIVIIIGSVTLSILLALSFSNFLGVKSSMGDKNFIQSKSLINACAEIALETVRENNNFVGTNSVLIDGNTCIYVVSNTGGNNKMFSISGNFNNIFRKLNINTSNFNPLVISSWQEIQ